MAWVNHNQPIVFIIFKDSRCVLVLTNKGDHYLFFLERKVQLRLGMLYKMSQDVARFQLLQLQKCMYFDQNSTGTIVPNLEMSVCFISVSAPTDFLPMLS